MPNLKIGDINLFTIQSVENHAYILSHDEANIPMEKHEANKHLNVGDKVEAFVYINHDKNLAATMKEPYIDQYRAGFVDVVEKKEGLGVFVDIGLKKDMLVSKDDLPHLKKQWPNIGDKLFCYLKTAKNQMVARPVSRFRMLEYIRPKTPLKKGDTVLAYVHRLSDEGLVLFTEAGHEIFVYYKHTRNEHRFGEALEVTITIVRDDLHYNGMLIEQKELVMAEDAKRILNYLEKHQEMDLHDKSSPEAIFDVFHMSKAAFKRALGQLYKADKVYLDKDKTRLK